MLKTVPYNPAQMVGILGATHAIKVKGEDPLGLAESVVLCMRLMKRGDVKYCLAFMKKHGKRLRAINVGFGKLYFSRNVYFLEEKELEDLKMLWKSVRRVDEKHYLAFSMKKFMETYDEKNGADKMVSLMAAFESIVFHKRAKAIEPAGEVIGIATAMLLGRNEKQRQRIRQILAKAYQVRNATVHGNAEKLKSLSKIDEHGYSSIDKEAQEVEDLLRASIGKFVEE